MRMKQIGQIQARNSTVDDRRSGVPANVPSRRSRRRSPAVCAPRRVAGCNEAAQNHGRRRQHNRVGLRLPAVTAAMLKAAEEPTMPAAKKFAPATSLMCRPVVSASTAESAAIWQNCTNVSTAAEWNTSAASAIT